jgi:RecA/RadA recombinase
MAKPEKDVFLQSLASLYEKEVPKFIRTGSTELDLCLGGGWERGAIGGIQGMESTDKTGLLTSTMKAFQEDEPNGEVIIDDAEAALNFRRAVEQQHLDPKRTKYRSSNTIEEWFAAVLKVCSMSEKDHRPRLYGLDSLDAPMTKVTNITDDMINNILKQGKAEKVFNMSTKLNKASLMPQIFQAICRRLKKADVTVLIISQLKTRVGVVFGDPAYVSCEGALKYYCTQRVTLSGRKKIERKMKHGDKKQVIGVVGKAKIIKNKIIEPFHECKLFIYFNRNLDDVEACVDFLKENSDILGTSKSLYQYKDIEAKTSRGFTTKIFQKPKLCARLVKTVQSIWESDFRIHDEDR